MTQNRRQMWDDRQLPCTDRAHRKRVLSPSSCLFASLVFAALTCGGCQTSLPPLPNPPGPKTTVRLSPGDTIKVSYSDESVSGFANKPGKFSFDRPTTVFQAIMEAGGVSDYGSLRNIHLTRIINGEHRTETINLRPTIRGEPTR